MTCRRNDVYNSISKDQNPSIVYGTSRETGHENPFDAFPSERAFQDRVLYAARDGAIIPAVHTDRTFYHPLALTGTGSASFDPAGVAQWGGTSRSADRSASPLERSVEDFTCGVQLRQVLYRFRKCGGVCLAQARNRIDRILDRSEAFRKYSGVSCISENGRGFNNGKHCALADSLQA